MSTPWQTAEELLQEITTLEEFSKLEEGVRALQVHEMVDALLARWCRTLMMDCPPEKLPVMQGMIIGLITLGNAFELSKKEPLKDGNG